MKRNYLSRCAIVSLVLMLVSACAGTAGLSLGESATTTTVSGTCEQLLNHQPDFRTMNATVELAVQFGKQSHKGRANLKMIQDSVIQLSIQPVVLNMEVFRARFTPDSVKIIDRLHRQYICTDYRFVREKFGVNVDFYTLQNLFANRFFLAGRQQLYSSDFDSFVLNPFPDGYTLFCKNGDFNYDHEFTANKSFRIEQTTLTDKRNPYSIRCDYAGFEEKDGVIFPRTLKMRLFDGQSTNQIDLNFVELSFNKPVRAQFGIPAKYKEIEN